MLAGIRWSLTSFSQKENVSCEQVIPLRRSTGFLSPFWIIWQLLEPRYYICLNQTGNSDVPACSKSQRSWTNNWAVPKAATTISVEFWVCSPAHTPSQSAHMQNLIPFLWVQNEDRKNNSTLNSSSAFFPDSQKCKLQSLLWALAQFSSAEDDLRKQSYWRWRAGKVRYWSFLFTSTKLEKKNKLVIPLFVTNFPLYCALSG